VVCVFCGSICQEHSQHGPAERQKERPASTARITTRWRWPGQTIRSNLARCDSATQDEAPLQVIVDPLADTGRRLRRYVMRLCGYRTHRASVANDPR
jgi:hypothetical protein